MDDRIVSTEEHDVVDAEQRPALTSRRRMFQMGSIGAAALAGGVVAEALGAQAASAADGGNMVIGQANTSSTVTSLSNNNPNAGVAFEATSGGTRPVAGIIGTGSPGVQGNGTGATVNGPGVVGTGNPGVQGSGNPGVKGTTSSNKQSGVVGADTSSGGGTGVLGTSSHGVGVSASSSHGTALFVHGKVKFSRSGSTSIPKGKSSVTVNLSGVSASSLVLATLKHVESGIYLVAAAPGTNSFKITVNKAVPAALAVAWMVIG